MATYNYIKTAMRYSWHTLSCSITLGLAVAIPANAGLVSGWWGGSWNCNIDGRSAQMRWTVVEDVEPPCNSDLCSSSSGVHWEGRFSDNGGRWVALKNPRTATNTGGLFFNHADGNRWYLAKPVSNKASGWTTWNGNRYPLSCRR